MITADIIDYRGFEIEVERDGKRWVSSYFIPMPDGSDCECADWSDTREGCLETARQSVDHHLDTPED